MASLDSLQNKLAGLEDDQNAISKKINKLKEIRKKLVKYKRNFVLDVLNVNIEARNKFRSSFWKGKRANDFSNDITSLLEKDKQYKDNLIEASITKIDTKIKELNSQLSDLSQEIKTVNSQIKAKKKELNS